MTGDCHVRFCERLRVRFPRPTRRVIVLSQKEETAYKEFLEYIEIELKLKVNREKTKTDTIKGGVEYLGFHLKEKTSRRKKQYLSVEPSKESMKGIRKKIRDVTKRQTKLSNNATIESVNRKLKGWQQYFDNIAMGKTRGQIMRYAELRMVKFISKRNKRRGCCWKLFKGSKIYDKYGLYRMGNLGRNFATR